MPLICVCSPKGGVGKTTLAANLAYSLARTGSKVLALDFDVQNALRLHFGVPLNDERGYVAKALELHDWSQCVLSAGSNIFVLPYGEVSEAQRQAFLERFVEGGQGVGFAVLGGAFAEGVGEQLQPVELAEPWFLVAIPQVNVSTAEVFAAPELTRDTPAITVRSLPEGGGHNDCQPVVEKRYPEVRNALKTLNKFVDAKMTGTGACVFGSFPNQADADKVSRQLPDTLPSFIARGCNRSPLHRRLETVTRK